MNILHVTDVYARQPGGVPTFIRDLVRATPEKNHSVLTFSYEASAPNEEKIEGVRVIYAPIKKGLKPFYLSGQKNMKERINKLKRTHHIDVLHIHMPFSGLAVASQLVSMPILYTFHGSWGDEYAYEAKGIKRSTGIYKLERRYMRRIERRALEYASTIVTLSDYMRNEVAKYNISPPHSYDKIPGAIDLNEFHVISNEERSELKQRYNMSPEKLNIFLLRRLVKRVGIGAFIQTLAIIKSQRRDFHVYIGGKGPERERLEKLVSEEDLRSYVTFLGFISDEDRVIYYNSADVTVMPSRTMEGFGLATLESMACGTPVIGFPTGANTELIGSFNDSFLSSEATPKSLAENMLKNWNLLKSGSMREQSRSYAENFSYEVFGQRYNKIYNKLSQGIIT